MKFNANVHDEIATLENNIEFESAKLHYSFEDSRMYKYRVMQV